MSIKTWTVLKAQQENWPAGTAVIFFALLSPTLEPAVLQAGAFGAEPVSPRKGPGWDVCVQWLRVHLPVQRDAGSIPGWGARVPRCSACTSAEK